MLFFPAYTYTCIYKFVVFDVEKNLDHSDRGKKKRKCVDMSSFWGLAQQLCRTLENSYAPSEGQNLTVNSVQIVKSLSEVVCSSSTWQTKFVVWNQSIPCGKKIKYLFKQARKTKSKPENSGENQVEEALGEVSYVCVVLISGAQISSSCRYTK